MSQNIWLYMSLPVFAVKRSHSRFITPTAMASTRGVAARSLSLPCLFTPRYWSITCRKSRPSLAELRDRPHPPLCLGRESGNARGSDRHTAKERKVMGERGVRGNWCSLRTKERQLVEDPGKGKLKMRDRMRGEGSWGGRVALWWMAVREEEWRMN